MYKIIIVDDEDIVRMGLKDLICWENYGYEVCAEAINGKEALEKIKKDKPNLVITDVKMPVMSGLELIQEIKKENIECEFIILSGYSEFEYAKKAMTFGVKDYLLKPIDDEELIENLKSIKKCLDEKQYLNKEVIQKNFFRQILLNIKDCDELDNEIEHYGFDLKYDLFCIGIINIEYERDEQKTKYMKEWEYFISSLKNIEYVIMERLIVLISKGISYKEFGKILKERNKEFEKKYNKKYFICLGNDVSNLKDLSCSYETAKVLKSYRFIYPKQEILTIDILSSEGKRSELDIDFSEITMLIEANNVAMIKKTLENIKREMKESIKDEMAIKLKIIHDMILIQNKLEKSYFECKMQFLDMEEILNNVNNAKNLDELFEIVYDYSARTSKILYDSNSVSVVKRIYIFMEKNYSTDLKLEKIAKLFNYNKAYLGKIIKQEMGDYFNNLLDYIRINKAKEFLLETNLKVYQISEKVGYCTLDYFYIKFKKYTGTSPTEYRTQNKKNNK